MMGVSAVNGRDPWLGNIPWLRETGTGTVPYAETMARWQDAIRAADAGSLGVTDHANSELSCRGSGAAPTGADDAWATADATSSTALGPAPPTDRYRGDIESFAQGNGISFSEAEFALLAATADSLSADIYSWQGSDNDPIFDQLVRERDHALERLANGDEDLQRLITDRVRNGDSTADAVFDAPAEHYADLSITELLAEHERRAAGPVVFDPLLFGLEASLLERAEGYTGADAADINIEIVALAEENGISYNAAVAQINSQFAAEDSTWPEDTRPFAYIDAPLSSGDEVAHRLMADEALFVELETAAEGDTGNHDGRWHRSDWEAVLADPDSFSPGAVAIAEFMKANPDEWARFDNARGDGTLTGLARGEHLSDVDDDVTSYADIQQQPINTMVFETLNEARLSGKLVDSNNTGVFEEDEFQAALERIGDDHPRLAEAIQYALDADLDGLPDTRSWYRQTGDGAWEIGSLNPLNPLNPAFAWRSATEPGELGRDYVSFGDGGVDAVVGMAQFGYDISAALPGLTSGSLYELEMWRVGGDPTQHRGLRMRQALPGLTESAMSLDPSRPQFWEAYADVRRQGTWDAHGGLTLLKTTADWETFVNDPSRWAGQLAPDILFEIFTGGGGAITRVGSTAGRLSRAGRHLLTDMVENGMVYTARESLREGAERLVPRLGRGAIGPNPPGGSWRQAPDQAWWGSDVEGPLWMDEGVPPPGPTRGPKRPAELTAGPATVPADFADVAGIHDLRSRIPAHATRGQWKIIPGRAEQGIKWQWTDSAGNRWRVHAHERDPGAPRSVGPSMRQTNSSQNWIFRVEMRVNNKGKWMTLDSNGEWHVPNVLKPGKAKFDPEVANDTHIPLRPGGAS